MRRQLAILLLRVRSLFRRRAVERELSSELEAHFDALTAEHVAKGLALTEARLAANREMGGMAQIAEQCRDQRRTGMWDRALSDVKYSARVLRKQPMFAVIAVATLALGIGANTLMFSLVESILLRPLPYGDSRQLLWVTQTSARMPMGVVLPPEFAHWQGESHTFSALGAWNDAEFTLTGARNPLHVSAAAVNAGFLHTLGIKPALGRGFVVSEDGHNPARVAVLSDALWRSEFAADRNIIGRSIVLNSNGYTVVGVLSPQFRFPDSSQPDIYLPGGFSSPAEWNTPRMGLLRVVGRLRPGYGQAQARAELKAINERHAVDIPPPYRRAFLGRVLEIVPLHEKLVGDLRPALLVLWGAVCLLLLLTCSNLAALQMARGFARSSEFAVRLALGADRKRIVQLLLTENLLLASAGAVFGVAGAYGLLPAVRGLNALHLASPHDVSIDPMVWLTALALTVGSALLFGLGPSVAACALSPNETLKSGSISIAGGSWNDRARSVLVAAQIALALTLVLSAALLLKSAVKLLSNPLGLQPAHLVTARLRVDPQRYAKDAQVAVLGREVEQRITHIPGVESAGLTNALPLAGYSLGAAVVFEGRSVPPPGARPSVPVIAITPDYLRTLEVPILAGRGIGRGDRSGSTLVAIVNQSFAQHFFPHADPIGQHFRWGPDGAPWTEIVGIAANVRHQGLDVDPQPEIFVPFQQEPSKFLALAIRSSLPLQTLAPVIRRQFRTIDPNMPVFDIVTMEHRMADHLETRRIELFGIGTLSVLALLLAVTGMYGVTDYVVSRRTREFGIKLALGANPSRILMDVLTRALILAAAGLVPGFILGHAAARYLASLLYKVTPGDVNAYAGASILLILGLLLAWILPARRASRTDAIRAIRWE